MTKKNQPAGHITYPADLDLYQPIPLDVGTGSAIDTGIAGQFLKMLVRIAKENMRTRQYTETSAEEILASLQRQEEMILELKKQRQALEDRQEQIVRFVLELLDLLDGFTRSASKSQDPSLLPTAKVMSRALEPLLQRTGFLRIPALGETPDAIYHFVLDTQSAEEPSQRDKIIEVVRDGFTLNGEVVRKADVIVGK